MDPLNLSSLGSLSAYDVTSDSASPAPSHPAEETVRAGGGALDHRAVAEVAAAERFIHKEYLQNLTDAAVLPVADADTRIGAIRLCRIGKIVYAAEEDPADKLMSVYNALTRFCHQAVLLIRGRKNGVELYVGVRSPQNAEIAGELLTGAYLANFPGSLLTPLSEAETEAVLSDLPAKAEGKPAVSILSAVPARRGAEDPRVPFSQGLEHFVDTMRGHDYLCEVIVSPIPDGELHRRKQGYEELYSALYPYAKRTMSHGHNDGVTMTEGVSDSISRSISRGISLTTGSSKTATEGTSTGTNFGASMILSFGFNRSESDSYAVGRDVSRSTDEHEDESRSLTRQTSESVTRGVTDNLSIELKNKSIEDMLEVIDRHVARMDEGSSYGMWEAAAYFIAPTVKECAMAAGTFKSLMAGDDSGIERAHVNYFDGADPAAETVLSSLRCCVHPRFVIENDLTPGETLTVRPTAPVSGRELPFLLGFPRRSVSGVSVLQMAAFGRNILTGREMSPRRLEVGHIHYMNQTDETVPAVLDAESFTAHCFITGSTGSGKSNTVYRLIDCLTAPEVDVSFLVIEPAKGEYRREFSFLPDLNVFTANPFEEQFLKLNPFYFNPKIHVLEHLDRLIEIFNACWEMYAAMPAILKDALERAYIAKGWDLINSVHENRDAPVYPTFLDLLEQLPIVINESGYSADTKGDYKGALVTRVNSLTNGIYGQIFCDSVEIDEATLFDGRTIIDLSRIGSSETKSLLMGILVLKLSEYRMAQATGSNQKLRHVTILEEAHNLLKNTRGANATAGNSIVAKSVEMITACIAEMRTYGEGFIIVDQSPTSVDISAIKNTNTKIVMRLPEKDDCELCGAALSLTPEQTAELSRLETGVAVVMQNNWTEAVQAKIHHAVHPAPATAERTDIDTLMRFRAVVAEAMVDAFILEDGYDESRILERIERFDINLAKKKEMTRYIKTLAARLRRAGDAGTVGRTVGLSLTRILGFEDVFKRAEKKIRKTEDGRYDPESMDQWREAVIEQLHHFTDSDARHKKRMFQYMLYAQDNPARSVDYGYLYRNYYVR